MYVKTLLILAAASTTVFPAVLPAEPSKPPTDVPAVLIVPDKEELQVFYVTGQDVTVKGSYNRIIITGECGTLTISGDANLVTVQSVSNIVYTGHYNKVVYNNGASSKPTPTYPKDDKQNNITHPGGQS